MLAEKNRKRYVKKLNQNWKFHLGEENKAWMKGFNDSKWQNIDLPHDWAVEQDFDKKHSSGTGYLPAGTAIYRKHFKLPKFSESKKVFIKFDGVYNNSKVWINSNYLGKRPSGYSEFIYDISDFVNFGEKENLVTVRVNHKHESDSRWYTGSGIYRKVTIIVKKLINIDNYGVFISTESSNSKKAVISISTNVNNDKNCKDEIKLINEIYDKDNNLITQVEEKVELRAQQEKKVNQKLELQNPKLWATDSPYLYSCLTKIKKNNELIDDLSTEFGVRSIKFDADQGFYLNDKNMKLKGVCVHHDAGCLGAAVTKNVWRRRLKKLKELGANAIRMSHNPHMPELYDLCDEMGFLVIDEAFDEWEGVKNKWSTGHNVYPPLHHGYYENFPEWHQKDLSSLILRDRNHPSVIMWSIGNEIDYPNDPYCHPAFETMTGNNDANKPAAERKYDPDKPNAERITKIAENLTSIVKSCDQTRPVTAAVAFPQLSNLIGYSDVLDVVGYNYKEKHYQEDHQNYPERILFGSENSKDLAEWLYVKNNDYIFGQFLWTGFDFLGETQLWPSHGSKAGLMDLAAFKKPVYYFRQSLWAEQEMLKIFAIAKADIDDNHIYYNDKLKSDWDFNEGDEVRIIAFSNSDQIEIFLNDKSAGIKNRADKKDGYFFWDLNFEKGRLSAHSVKNSEVEDCLESKGTAVKMDLKVEDNRKEWKTGDLIHVVVNLVDADDRLVSSAENDVKISVNGAAELAGLENGNLEDNTPYRLEHRRAYKGKLLAYIRLTDTKFPIIIKAESKLLESAQVLIK